MSDRPQTGLPSIRHEDVEAFDRQGAVCLRRVFDEGWIERMRARVEARIAHPGPMRHEFSRDGARGRFFDDVFLWTDDAGFRDFVFHSPAAAIAARLMRATRINLFCDQLFVKEPGAVERTPWHQDLPYYPLRGWQICSIWFALDPVSRDSGALEYVSGSHRWEIRYRPRTFTDKAIGGHHLPEVPDIEAMRDRLEILQWELEPGDCVVHHALTLHGAPGNSTATQRRRGLVTRWAGDDVRYAPWPDRQLLPRDPGIPADAPLGGELFPRVWPQPS